MDFDPPYSARNLLKASASAVVGVGNTVAKIIRMLTKMSKPESGYNIWRRRRDGAVQIQCVLRRGRSNEEALGGFAMHLDAPCDVCREFVKRNFREQLNQSVGDSFRIIYNDERGEHKLLREREYRTYSKTVIPFIVDPSTLLGTYILTIAEEEGEEYTPIPEFEGDVLLLEKSDDGASMARIEAANPNL